MSKEFLDIQATIECRFTLKRVRDMIVTFFVKMPANVIDKHLCNNINMDIDNYNVSDKTEVATVRLLYKENPETNKKTIDPFPY